MNTLACDIRERRCLLSNQQTGACGLYQVKEGRIVERFSDRYLSGLPDFNRNHTHTAFLPQEKTNSLNQISPPFFAHLNS